MSIADLHDRRDLMDAFFDMSLDLLGVASTDGYFVKLNNRWTQVLGYDLEALQSQPFMQLVHPGDVDRTVGAMSVLADGADVQQFVNRYRHADGHYLHLEWQARPDGAGHIFFIARNVSKRIELHNRLRRNNDLLTQVSRLSGVGHWEVDVKNGTVFWDPVTRAIHEVDDDYVPNLTDGINFYAPEAREEVNRAVQEGIEQGKSWTFVLPMITAKGRRVWVRAVGEADYEDGEVVRLQGGFQDVSRDRRLREELKDRTEAAQQASRAKSEFLTNMSHEIRTPLHGILGTAQLLERTELDEAQTTYLHIIRNSGHALLNLIEDVLDMAKIETGRLVIDNREFSLASVLMIAGDSVSYQARSKGLDYATIIDDALPRRMRGDPKRLGQIVTNFLGNAVKFTPSGRIELRALRAGADRVRIEVTDTGPGLSEADQAAVFERFRQADVTRDQHARGAGLGLAISQEIAMAAKGEIGVTSRLGHGATFWVELPVEFLSDEDETVTSDAGQQRVERHYSVLVVDDVATNRLVASAALRGAGCDVVEASDGQEAIDQLDAREFDAVLMDIQMPGLSGDMAIRQIRASAAPYSSIPIFAMTADATHDAAERYSRVGATGYLTKPLDFDDVLEALDSVLQTAMKG